MRVLMSMLYDGLSDRFHCELGTCFNPTTVTGFVMQTAMFQDPDLWGGVLFVSFDDLCVIPRGFPLTNLVVISDHAPRELPCAFFIRGNADKEKVESAADKVLMRYRAWSERLFDRMLQGDSLTTLLNYAQTMLNNPITIIDQSLNAIAFSQNDVLDDKLWTSMSQEGSIDYSEIGVDSMRDFITRMRLEEKVHDFPTVGKYGISACVACNNESDMVIVCLVHKSRQVTQGDFACLQFFAELVGLAIQRENTEWSAEVGGSRALLIDALEGKISSSVELERRTALLGMRIQGIHEVIVVQSQDKDGFSEREAQSVLQLVDGILIDGHTIVYKRAIVAVLNYDKGRLPHQKDMDTFRNHMVTRGLIAGISDRSDSFLDIKMLYDQANLALSIGKKVFKDERVIKYGRCRPFYLYECSYQRGDWEQFIHPAFEMLRHDDEGGKTDLFLTLVALLKNDGVRNATAKALFVQRNTLRYRIEKIEKICGISLADADTIHHLRISLGLYEYCVGEIKLSDESEGAIRTDHLSLTTPFHRAPRS